MANITVGWCPTHAPVVSVLIGKYTRGPSQTLITTKKILTKRMYALIFARNMKTLRMRPIKKAGNTTCFLTKIHNEIMFSKRRKFIIRYVFHRFSSHSSRSLFFEIRIIFMICEQRVWLYNMNLYLKKFMFTALIFLFYCKIILLKIADPLLAMHASG